MNEMQADLLRTFRRRIAEYRDHLEHFESGKTRLLTNNVDVTPEWIAALKHRISELEEVVERHDPHGLTADATTP